MVKPASQRARHANQHLHPHHIRRKTAAVAVAACFTTSVALANPTAPTVVHGTAAMSQAGGILNITNSHNAIINWGSFSIGVNELTRFIQPSALSAVLNRVVGQDPSAILGALQSNGRVFLINPNGIMFGSGAQINVAGLVASTLNISNDDFLNNRMRFTDGAGAGSIVNQGSITGGSVYLIGNAVANKGLITSPNGEVVLAAGNSVELVNPGTPNLRVEVVAPANEAVNLGSISAEAGRVGIYAGLVKQGGTINANSAVAEGGRIMLKSTRSTVIEAGSVTTARGTSGGQIVALSDMTDGKTEVAGKLDASAIASGTPGAGGFIETSAAKVKIADSAVITAAGSNGGKAGTWLIDPADFYISNAYGGDMSATALSSTLASYGSGTNVDILSTSGLTGSTGTIFVNDAVSWHTDSTLRLIAVGGVTVNSAINNTGAGSVQLFAGWTGSYDLSPVPVPLIGSTGVPSNINLNAPIVTGGDIHLIAYGNIVQGAPGSLTASGLAAYSETGSVNLANASATNTVSTVAGRAIGQFAFKNTGNLTVGAVGVASGIAAYGASPGLHATVNVDVAGGSLTVSNPISAIGIGGSGGAAGGNANISLSATNGMTINANLVATAGHGASAFYGGTPGDGGIATINLSNTGSPSSALVIGNGVSVLATGGGGGDSFGFYGGSVGARGGDAVVTLTSAGSITVEGLVQPIGGHGGYGLSGGRGGDGIITMTASGGDLTIAAYGGVAAWGGSGGGSGGTGYNNSGGRGGDGSVALAAYGGLTVSGTVRAYGGSGGSGSSGAAGRGGDAVINLTAGTGMTGELNIDSTIANAVKAEGGEGGVGYWTGAGGRGGNAAVNLTSSGAMTLGKSSTPYNSTAYALGGAGGRADGGEGMTGGDGGHGTVTASSAGGITVNAVIEARGGEAYLGSSGTNFRGRGGDAFINLNNTNAGIYGFVQTTSSGMTAQGGRGAVGGDASVSITSAAGIEVQSVYAYGGEGNSSLSALRRGGNALITLQNTSDSAPLTIYSSSVNAYGGNVGGIGSGIGHGGNASIVVSSAGGIDQWGNLYAIGGDGQLSGNGGSAFIQLTATGGLGVRNDGNIYANGGSGGDAGSTNGGVGGNAEIRLISSHGIDGGEFNNVEARGGRGGTAYNGTFNGGAGGSGTVFIENTSATVGVSIGASVTADGGEGGAGRGLGAIGGRGGDATVTITSSSTIDIYYDGYLSAQGGSGGYATSFDSGPSSTLFLDPSAQGGRGGDGSVSLTAAGGITVVGNYGINVDGGRGGSGAYNYGGSGAWFSYSGTGGRGGNAAATLQAGNGITFTDYTYLSVYGGDGGRRSTGTPEVVGNGGNASVTLINTGSAPISMSGLYSAVYTRGGDGSVGGDASVVMTSAGGISFTNGMGINAYSGWGENGGPAGSASIQLTSTSTSTGITIDGASVSADGGEGGYNNAGPGGRGGNASISISSAGGILVKDSVRAIGGSGGSASSGFAPGNGGNATVMFSNTSTTAPIAIIRDYSTAYGLVQADGRGGLAGGNADVAMTSAAGFVLQSTEVSASGGSGNAFLSTPGQGGTASVVLTNTNPGADISAGNSFIYASGGSLSRNGSSGGNGGDSVVILSSAGGINLSNSFAGGSGGNVSGSGGAASDRGGAAALTLLAGGNILIEGGEGSARGGSAPPGAGGGSAAVNIVAGGNILIEGGEGSANIRTHVMSGATSSVVVAAAGNLDLYGASVQSDGLTGLGGANIFVEFSSVSGGTGVQVDASGSLSVSSAGIYSGGNAKITTGGNVLVENNGLIAGYPDVVMKVGGEIFLNTGGQIYAGLPTTIYLTFPMLESGGYTVNGIPGLVFDGTTGFFAGGSGAILGTNLLVTYGGGASLVVPTDTLIVAMSESVKPPDAEKKKDIFDDEKDAKKKKETASCR